MMYVPFPSLSPEEVSQKRASAVDVALIKTSPGDAIDRSKLENVDRFRVVNRFGKPIYVISPEHGEAIAVSAINGQPAAVSEQEAKRIAADFTGEAAGQSQGPLAYDQWVVSDEYDSFRPFFRVRFGDDSETALYVSARTGEIVQRTTSRERFWNRFGAVVHWIYPTVLRKHWALWDQVVWWLGLFGIVVVGTGGYLGIVMARKSLQAKGKSISPYRSWLRWHHILGLLGGVFVLTWIVSGWLSMDHGRLFSTPQPLAGQTALFRGIDLQEAVRKVQLRDLTQLGSFQEAEVLAINGVVVLVARSAGSQRLYGIDAGRRIAPGAEEIPESLIRDAVASAWPGTGITIERPSESDVYANLRSGALPRSTVRAILDDREKTWVHVDAASGRIVSVMDRSRRVYRWLYNGLHSFDFPGLVQSRPIWDIAMLIPLSAGFLFSVTALVLGIKRIRKSLPK